MGSDIVTATADPAGVATAAEGAIRVGLGVLLVGFLPGLWLSLAVLPRNVGALERFVLAVGLSLACSAVGGLILNELHLLNPRGWFTLVSITAAASFGVWGLGQPVGGEQSVWRLAHPPSIGAVGLLAAAVATAGIAFALARHSAQSMEPFPYTQFWASADQRVISVHIRNREGAAASYRVEVRTPESHIGDWIVAGLPPDGEAEKTFTIQGNEAAPTRATALLYKDGADVVYRRLFLWR